MIFSVWAPLATQGVELVCGPDRFAMQADSDCIWRVDCAPVHISVGYKYSIDGGAAMPDPRSRWQPEGVHGASFLVDESCIKDISSGEFEAKPLSSAVIYELHIGTFTAEGTYISATEKLPHLVALGVTHIEIMPLATFPGGRGWGYDGVFLFAPHPAYGHPEDLARLIAACHSQGVAVLLDVVYNHLGPDGNYLSRFAPYFTDRVKTAWGDAVNYDEAHSDGVRQFVIDNARMWLEVYGFDGLRLDAVHALSSFEAVHVLEDLAKSVHALSLASGRGLILIAESDLNDPQLVYPPARGGYGLTAHWADDFHHAVHRLFTGETSGYYADFNGLADLATALRDGYVYQGQYSLHRKRRHGRVPHDVRADQLVVSAQNHDQIGNRANGERLSMLLNPMQLKAVAALTVLSPYVPLLFQGEEWGASTPFLYFTDHDEKLGQLVAEGRRKEFESFGWQQEVPNPQSLDTFLRSRLHWQELADPVHHELLLWYREIIRLRPKRPPPSGIKAEVVYDLEAQWLSMAYGELCLLVNVCEQVQVLPRPMGDWSLLLTSASRKSIADPFSGYETRILGRHTQ